MKNFKSYAFLSFLFYGNIAVSAQSMLNVLKPMFIIVGREDKAFSSIVIKKVILISSNDVFLVIDKASYNGVRHNAQSFSYIKDWFSEWQ